jgi:hypothetical protein
MWLCWNILSVVTFKVLNLVLYFIFSISNKNSILLITFDFWCSRLLVGWLCVSIPSLFFYTILFCGFNLCYFLFAYKLYLWRVLAKTNKLSNLMDRKFAFSFVSLSACNCSISCLSLKIATNNSIKLNNIAFFHFH